ncbi:MAG: hypothetical protein IPM64_01005 [Phycisphaerales bacterium]|nr:hypothetical protein [Phycisphaerales bacterium]
MRSIITRWAGFALTAALLTPVFAQADILDDIFSIATAARDRATEARNNAAHARDRATEARNNAAAARDTAITARDTAIEMRDAMRAGLDGLSVTIQDAIEEAVEDLEREIADERAGRDAFVNGTAGETFREQLVGLLLNSESLLNGLNSISGMQAAQINLQQEAGLISALPVRSLYPVYRTTSAQSPAMLPQFNALLSGAADDLEVIRGLLLNSPSAVEGDLVDKELNECAYVLEHIDELRRASGNLSKFSLAAKTLGAILVAAGTTEIHKNGAVWGWVGVSIKNNRVKKIGLLIEGIGDGVSGLVSDVNTRIRTCAAVGIAAEARERELTIIENQKLILKHLKAQQPDYRKP